MAMAAGPEDQGVWGDRVARLMGVLLLGLALFLANDHQGLRIFQLVQWVRPEMQDQELLSWMHTWSLVIGHPLTLPGLAWIFFMGLIAGGLLNVVITRTPPREAVLARARAWAELGYARAADRELEKVPPDYDTGRSRCIHCTKPIPPWLAFPVVGWLRLRGRTACCGQTIPVRYPVVELLTAVIFVVLARHFGYDPILPALFIFSGVLIVLAVIDIEHLILPDRLVLPLLWCGLAVNLGGALVSPDQAVAGAIIGFGLFRVCRWGHCRLTGRIGLGLGDCKLAAAIGAWCGSMGLLQASILGTGAAFLFGCFCAFGNNRKVFGRFRAFGNNRKGWKNREGRYLPLGPWLAGGAFFQLLFPDLIPGLLGRLLA